jgi:hypothetical protein
MLSNLKHSYPQKHQGASLSLSPPLSPLSLFNDRSPLPLLLRSNRLGFETWIASCHEVLHIGQIYRKNLIIIIDSDLRNADELSSNTQAFIEQVNPTADIIRMQPNNLWLNAEIMDSILASTEPSFQRTRPFIRQDSFPERMSQQLDLLPCLQAVEVELPQDHNHWDLERLQLLLRKCFPLATLSNTLPSDDLYFPQTQGLSGIQLALFLAKIKVFSERKRQKGLAQFQALFQQFNEPELSSVRAGILSVHAVISFQQKSQAPLFVCLEASAASIIIRSCQQPEREAYSSNLIHVLGSFSAQDTSLLHKLFATCCIPYSLEKRHLLNDSDISSSVYPLIEQIFRDTPLPSGWWYDGTGYVDVYGTRLMNRPDMKSLVSRYVEEKNGDIVEYNQLMQSVNGFV